MKSKKLLTAAALLAVGALALSGCSAGKASDGKVTMTFWHNSTTGDGKAYWESTVKAFEKANPNVTIQIQAIQNEEMDGKLQTALNSGDAPDIFMARGGGKLADVVTAGKVQDLTGSLTAATKKALAGVLDAFKIDGKIYGLPTAVLPEGIWYSTDLFTKAGITKTPTT
ncbi:MAG: extracellular solute-binding protein, partial [Rhodoglobus sp.]